MFFPIGDDQVKGGHYPILSYLFIVINVLVFAYEASLTPDQLQVFVSSWGSIPVETVAGDDLHTLVTSMFLHGG